MAGRIRFTTLIVWLASACASNHQVGRTDAYEEAVDFPDVDTTDSPRLDSPPTDTPMGVDAPPGDAGAAPVAFALGCWGATSSGQLGQGSTSTLIRTPIAVPGLTNVDHIAAGTAHTCAVLSTDAVRCWGANDHGQLGNGMTAMAVASPVQVS